MDPKKVKKQKCAIYTRVSAEEQLTSDFTSLDSQRGYSEDYIRSQKELGWEPSVDIKDGARILFEWIIRNRNLFEQ